MEPVDYLRIFRRRWWIIATAFLISIVAVFVTTPAAKPVAPTRLTETSYQATTVLLRQPDPRNINTGNSAQSADLGLTAFYVTTGDVPRRVAAKLGLPDDPATLASRVKAEADKDLPALRITAVATDGELAVQLANTFADELLGFLDQVEQEKYQKAVDVALARSDDLQAQLRKLDRSLPTGTPLEPTLVAERDALTRQYGNAYERYQQLVSTGPGTSGLATLQAATAVPITPAPTDNFKPPDGRAGRLLILASLGLLLGAGAAVLVDRLDHRLRTKEQTEEAFSLPVLAEVPLLPRLHRRGHQVVSVVAPQSMTAEAYRMLRTALLLMPSAGLGFDGHASAGTGTNGHGRLTSVRPATKRNQPQVILVTSPGPGEGKTTSIANLAASFAEMGSRVLVLSYDLRCPRIHEFLGLDEGLGLTDVLATAPGAPDLAHVARPTDVAGVRLVTSGSKSNLSECVLPAAATIDEARGLAEIVLIDASPLLTMADASELVPSVDAVLLVAKAGATDAAAARRSTELLVRLGAPVAGVALIGARDLPGRPRGYYHDRTSLDGRRWTSRPTRATAGGDAENGLTEARRRAEAAAEAAAEEAAIAQPAPLAPAPSPTGDGRGQVQTPRSLWPRG